MKDNSESLLDKEEQLLKAKIKKEQEQEELYKNHTSYHVLGRDITKIPCLRNSLLYGGSSGLIAGIVYNAVRSKNPSKVAIGVYGVVTFSYWFYCRYNFRMGEQKMKKLQYAMQEYSQSEGTKSMPTFGEKQTFKKWGFEEDELYNESKSKKT